MLVKVHALDFDPEPVRRHYESILSGESRDGHCAVLSNERLVGHALSGGYDSKDIADRLNQTFPEARVLMGIREQHAMILSTYNNYIRSGGTCRLKDYLEPPLRAYRAPHFDFGYFRYDKIIGHYRQLFGPENVLVLPLEHLHAEPVDYVGRILDFCGLELDFPVQSEQRFRESLSPMVNSVQRVLNPFIRRDPSNAYSGLAVERFTERTISGLRWVDRRIPRSVRARSKERMLQEVRTIVGDRYKASNLETQKYTPLDLSRYGYL